MLDASQPAEILGSFPAPPDAGAKRLEIALVIGFVSCLTTSLTPHV